MEFDFESELYRLLARAKEAKECPEYMIEALIDIAVSIASTQLEKTYCIPCFMSLHLHESISHQTPFACIPPNEVFKKELADFRKRIRIENN